MVVGVIGKGSDNGGVQTAASRELLLRVASDHSCKLQEGSNLYFHGFEHKLLIHEEMKCQLFLAHFGH